MRIIHAETNAARVPCYSPWRYPGGKSWFVPAARRWLRSTRPTHLAGVFAGGAQVELAAAIEGLVDRVTLIELDAGVCASWRAILEDPIGTARLLRECDGPGDVNRIDVRLDALMRNRTNFGGIIAPGAGRQRTHYGRPARWYPETLARRIEMIGAVADRIELVEGSAFDVLPALDADTAVFADPPYVAAGARLYEHGTIDHGALVELLAAHTGPVVATWDDHELVRSAAVRCGLDLGLVAAAQRSRPGASRELVVGRLEWAAERIGQLDLFGAA